MNRAPELGLVQFRDVRIDDILTVDLAIDPSKMRSTHYLHIVEIEVDGTASETFVTMLSK